jgi:hypothetical protein
MNTDEKPLYIMTLALKALTTTTVEHCRMLPLSEETAKYFDRLPSLE